MRLGRLAERDGHLFKIQIHKFRVNTKALPAAVRAESREWLVKEGFNEYREITIDEG